MFDVPDEFLEDTLSTWLFAVGFIVDLMDEVGFTTREPYSLLVAEL